MTKKKINDQANSSQTGVDQEEQFIRKHHSFMRQVLNQFIEHN